MNDLQKIGIGLTALGVAFYLLGVILLFDKGLLAMGDVLFVSGIFLILGVQRSVRFFFARRKLKGTLCFFAGLLCVLAGWAVLGTLVQTWGFMNLFGDFFPVAAAFLRRVPGVGRVFELPWVQRVIERGASTAGGGGGSGSGGETFSMYSEKLPV